VKYDLKKFGIRFSSPSKEKLIGIMPEDLAKQVDYLLPDSTQ